MSKLSANFLLAGASVLLVAVSLYFAFFLPGYFTDLQLLGGVFFLEVMLAVAWRFERRFFPVLLIVFLAAGTDVPWSATWTSVRWAVLAFGSIVGMAIYLRNSQCSFGIFHLTAFFCCLAAFVSALVSNSPEASVGKAASLLLLFLFGTGGARLAIRNPRFARGLLNGCEGMVYFTVLSYGVFDVEFFGNSNSLGAVMGIGCMPLLLWGSIVEETRTLRIRRTLAFLLAMLLCLDSYSRASISAGLIACAFLCVGFRRYSLLIKGLAIAGVAAVLVMTFRPLESATKADTLVSAFVYKGHPDESVLASRKTPWDETISSIQQSPWFGTGFGTSFVASQEKQKVNALRSFTGITREHGNSYLAITEWVGLLGIIPFIGLLLLVVRSVMLGFITLRRLRYTNALFTPLSAVLLAGMIGAFFEDWMFAVGSYLCVFFWSLAFVLPDLLPAAEVAMTSIPGPLQPQPIASSWNPELGIALPGR
jgi:O-antigen ligase